MAIRFDRFTIKAREAVRAAQDLATDCGHQDIDGIHLVSALLAQTDGETITVDANGEGFAFV